MALNGLLNFGILFNARSNVLRVAKQVATGVAQVTRAQEDYARVTDSSRKATLGAQERAQNNAAIGSALGAMGIPLAAGAGLARSVMVAGNLEEQIDRVRIVAGDLAVTNEDLASTFMRISNVTGITAKNLGVVAEVMGTSGLSQGFRSAGFDAVGAMEDFVDTAAKFSVVSKQTPLVSARTLADLTLQLRLFEKGPRQMKRFMSALQVVGKNSASNAKQVAEFTKALVPLFNQFEETQLSIPQVLAIAGAVRSFGGEVTKSLIKTNVAGIFSVMAKNSGKFAEFLEMSPEKFITEKNTKPFEILVKLLGKLAEMRGNQQLFSESLRNLGLSSKRIQPLLAGASRQVDLMKRLADDAAGAYTGLTDVLEEDFKKAMDGLNRQMTRFWQIANNIMISVGTPFLGAITLILKGVNAIGTGIQLFLVTPLGKLVALTGGIIVINAMFWALSTALSMIATVLGASQMGASVGVFMTGLLDMLGAIAASPAAIVIIGGLIGLLTQLSRSVGPGLSKAAQAIGMLSDAFLKIARGKRLSLGEFKKLQESGLDRFLLGLIVVFRTIRDFFFGFVAGFNFFIEMLSKGMKAIGLGGVGSGFLFMLKQIASVFGLVTDGLTTAEILMRLLSKGAGVLLGGPMGAIAAIFLAIGEGLFFFIGGLAAAIAWLGKFEIFGFKIGKVLAGIALIAGGAFLTFITGGLGILFGLPLIFAGLGLLGQAFSSGPSMNMKAGQLPVTGSLDPETFGAEALKKVPFIQEQLKAGVAPGEDGVVLEAHFNPLLRLDGKELNAGLGTSAERQALRAGTIRKHGVVLPMTASTMA